MHGAAERTKACVLYAAALSVSLAAARAQSPEPAELLPFRRTVLARHGAVEPLEEARKNSVHAACDLPRYGLTMRARAHDSASAPPLDESLRPSLERAVIQGERRALHSAHDPSALSSGTLRFRRLGASTFVHLSGDGPARVFFGDGVPSPDVEESHCHLDVLQRGERHRALRASGWNLRILVLGGIPAGHEVHFHVDGVARRGTVTSRGHLEIRLEGRATSLIEVRRP